MKPATHQGVCSASFLPQKGLNILIVPLVNSGIVWVGVFKDLLTHLLITSHIPIRPNLPNSYHEHDQDHWPGYGPHSRGQHR